MLEIQNPVNEAAARAILRSLALPRVLVVADTFLSFGHETDSVYTHFGLTHLVRVLQGVAHVTLAHRTSDPAGANVSNHFLFTDAGLDEIDEVWLFGGGAVDNTADGGIPLSAGERDAVARFMERGGGVFATGDHGALGSTLCGELPRVRHMRRWYDSAPVFGVNRLDTIVPTGDVTYFEDQSDARPQRIDVDLVEVPVLFGRDRYPHALLCSRTGPIDVLPDHMHEGECTVPADLDTLYEGAPGLGPFAEWPTSRLGRRPEPVIIARAMAKDHVTRRAVPVDDYGPSVGRWFGAIAAYDGHQAGVGRVVTDSSFHHFVDINLIGDQYFVVHPTAQIPGHVWTDGFTGTPDGRTALAKIEQYFRNLAAWLAPAARRRASLVSMVADLVHSRHVREVMSRHPYDAHTRREAGAWLLDQLAIDRASCIVSDLVLPELADGPAVSGWWDLPDPGPEDGPVPHPPIGPRAVTEIALAGLVHAALDADWSDTDPAAGPRIAQLLDGARRSVTAGLEEIAAELRANLSWLDARVCSDV